MHQNDQMHLIKTYLASTQVLFLTMVYVIMIDNINERMLSSRKVFTLSYTFLLFDLDHTLLDFDAAEDVALTELLKEARVPDVQAYKDFYVPMNKALWDDLALGKISKQELVQCRFGKLFAHFGQQVDGRAFAHRYQYFLSRQGQTLSGAKELLDMLQDMGCRLFGATNGIAAIQKGRLAQSEIGQSFERVFISDEIGAQKPDKRFFDALAQEIPSFARSHALMIGDSLISDIQGGNNAAIDTVWYNPDNKANHSQVRPTYIIKDYQGLLTLMKREIRKS